MFQLSDEQIDNYLNTIELDFTTFCNLNCVDCARGCDKFPSKDVLSIEDVSTFVNYSIRLGKKWKSIGLLGGEPTLHPDLFGILDILWLYHYVFPDTNIWIMTNGIQGNIIRKLTLWYPWLNVVTNIDHSYHHAFYISPTDLGILGSNNRCEALRCGVGLGPYGYTPCVLGTFLHRVFGYTTIKYLQDIDYNVCQQLFPMYCQHCGWYLTDSDDKTKGKATEFPSGYMSETWRKLYNNQVK